jgi:recombinational DNA repair protein RecR
MKDIESNVYECIKCGNLSDDSICNRCKDKYKLILSISAITVSLLFIGSIIRFL